MVGIWYLVGGVVNRSRSPPAGNFDSAIEVGTVLFVSKTKEGGPVGGEGARLKDIEWVVEFENSNGCYCWQCIVCLLASSSTAIKTNTGR